MLEDAIVDEINFVRGNTPEQKISLEELQNEIAKALKIDNLCFLIGAGCSSMKIKSAEIGIPTMAGLFDGFFSSHPDFKIGNREAQDLFDNNLEKMMETLEAIKIANGIEVIDAQAPEKIIEISKYIRKQIITGIEQENHCLLNTYKNFYKRISQRKRKSPINIFTTNYDLFNEIALDELGYPYNNGFTGTYKRKFSPASYNYMYVDDMNLSKDVWEGSSFFFNLIKLHGSISWVRENTDVWERDYNTLDGNDTVMIYPTPMKDRSTLLTPYSDLFRVMENKLMQQNTILITLGYSFSDDHINRIILNALAVPSFKLIVFGESDNINRLIEIGDSRIIVVNSVDKIHYFGKFVETVLPHPSPEVLEQAQQKSFEAKIKSFTDGSKIDEQ